MLQNADYMTELASYFPFWDHLASSQQDALVQSVSLQRFARGELIHGLDVNCLGMLLLRSGVLRVYLLSEEGREITLYRLYPGDICVMTASCILPAITFDIYVDADQDSEILMIPSTSCSLLCKQSLHAECFIYKLITDRFSQVMWAMQQILFMSFDKRLAIFLVDESIQQQTHTLHMTHEQIAKYTGSAREVVSRMLKYFEHEGLVSLSRGGIALKDMARLRALTQ